MQRYIFIRLLQAIFVLFVVSIIVFGLTRLSGSPVDFMLPFNATQDDRDRLEAYWGLDRSMPEQYFKFLENAVNGGFGESVKWPGNTAMGMIKSRTVATLQLASAGLGLALVLALVFGVLSAVKKDTPIDYVGKIFAILGQSAPPFWVGIVLIWIFSVELGWLPTSGRGGFKHYILPVVTLGWFQVAAVMRLVRSSMLDALGSEYVKLARVKGLPEWKIVWKHALRNAAIVPLTYFGIIAGWLVMGTVIVETVFAWPGIGLLAFEALVGRDFQVVQAVVIVAAFVFVVINLVVDVLYAYLDPRIRLGEG